MISFYKSIVDQDRASIVICNLKHEIIYMNPAAVNSYAKRGGDKLIGRSLLDCHNPESRDKIQQVVEWFAANESHNIVYTFHNEKQNKDVYMVALRDEGKLIGYLTARYQIYLPAYNWVLENRLSDLTRKLKRLSQTRTVVLLDYETNGDVNDAGKPLSHASLVKAYVDAMPVIPEEPQQPAVDYAEGMMVRHAKFGDGKVVRVIPEESRIAVSFAEGEKVLSTRIAKLEIISE